MFSWILGSHTSLGQLEPLICIKTLKYPPFVVERFNTLSPKIKTLAFSAWTSHENEKFQKISGQVGTSEFQVPL